MSDNTNSAPDAKRKRAIQMKDFRDNDLMKALVTGAKTEGAIGQVVGVAYGVTIKKGTLPDGTPKDSKLIVGDFQGVNLATGVVTEAGGIYLPEFFADEIAAVTDKTEGGVTFAVEIGMERNPRAFNGNDYTGGVAYTYTVANMLPREAHDPLAQIKAKLAAAGKLGKLPPPSGVAQIAAPQGEPEAAPKGKGKAA